MRHRHRRPLRAVVATMALTLSACGGGAPSGAAPHGDSTGVTASSIALGTTFALSGPASAYGVIPKGTQAYFQYVNDHGGVNGRKIDYRVLDDGYSPPQTVQLTRQLVQQDRVFAMVGGFGTQQQMAVRQYLNDRRVPQLFVTSGAATWATDYHQFPWSISWLPTFATESMIDAGYVKRTLPGARIGVLYQNDDFGQDYLTGLERGMGDATRQILDREPYDVSAADVSSQVARLRGSGADTLFIFATARFAIQTMVSAYKLGWHPRTLLSYTSAASTIIDAVDRAAGSVDATEGITSVGFELDPGNPADASLPGTGLYQQIMGRYLPGADQSNVFYLTGMSNAYMVVDALRRAGADLTREGLMRAAASMSEPANPFLLPGVVARTTATDHFPITQMEIGHFHKGIFQLSGALEDTRSAMLSLVAH
jgi:branched-chain amino acid transport system substrate-binding protein